MLTFGFIFVNLIIFGAWFLFVASSHNRHRSDLIPYSGLLMAAQIVLSEIALGAVGLLYFSWVVALNLAFSCALTGWIFYSGRTQTLSYMCQIPGTLASRAPRNMGWGKIGWENIALISLLIFLTAWFCIVVYFLPPRGFDDLVYHLPPLYEFVQSHRISLLPLELRDNFAMPLAGDFLFLWPLIFFHADWMVDGVQWMAALFGVTVIYALARRFDMLRRDALFVSLLFPFIPVVLGQGGSNYVDLIVAVCHLVILYACIRFWQSGVRTDLVLAGLASGFGLGIKYNMLPAVLAIQPIIMLRLWRDGRLAGALRGYAVYALAAAPLCFYWFIRNFVETGFPLYPYDLGITGLHPVVASPLPQTGGAMGSPLGWFIGVPSLFFQYLLQDPGLGSFHGGFGVIFWGLGFPAMIYCTYRAASSLAEKNVFPMLFWSQAWVAFAVFLIQAEITRLIYNQRLIIVMVGFGLLACGMLFAKFRAELPHTVPVIKAFCIIASMLSVVHLAGYSWPTYQIKPAIMDWTEDQQTSEYKYYRQSSSGLPSLSTAWEPLDFLTMEGPGWNVYMAVRWDLFWTTPTFGSRIQNRVWNFLSEPTDDPDAFIFFRGGPDDELFYVGKRITPDEVAVDGRYELVTLAPYTEFWAKSELLARPETRTKLMEFYARTFGAMIEMLKPLIVEFPDDGILITSSSLGHALKYLSLTGVLRIPVHLVPAGQERFEAFQYRGRKIITIGAPLSGFKSRQLTELRAPDGRVGFFENVAR